MYLCLSLLIHLAGEDDSLALKKKVTTEDVFGPDLHIHDPESKWLSGECTVCLLRLKSVTSKHNTFAKWVDFSQRVASLHQGFFSTKRRCGGEMTFVKKQHNKLHHIATLQCKQTLLPFWSSKIKCDAKKEQLNNKELVIKKIKIMSQTVKF